MLMSFEMWIPQQSSSTYHVKWISRELPIITLSIAQYVSFPGCKTYSTSYVLDCNRQSLLFSVSSLVQSSFGMLYHLILSLLLLWISLNHISKPTTTKQFSIYICKYVTFSPLIYWLIINIWFAHAAACMVVTIDSVLYNVDIEVFDIWPF